MKKITLFLIMLGFFLTASAQYNFAPIVGPTNVASGTPVTINLNDVANVVGVPASSTGTYNSFSISLDWSAGGGNPYSGEADITVTTTAGSVLIDPPTTNGNLGDDAVVTFVGDFSAVYDPTVDGYIDLVLNQSWAGSDANWSNIVVTLLESPTCLEPSAMTSSGVTATDANLDWTSGDSETTWNVEYNGGADFVPGNGEEEGAANVTGTPTTALSGLTASTQYFVYYQADCGATNGTSEWVGPFEFTTLCDVYVPDYLENFTTIIPDCWDEADSGDAVTGPGDFGAGSWGNDGFLNNGFTGAYKINLWVANKSDWIISPQFDLTGGPFQVEFDFGIMTFGSSTTAGTLGSDDTVQLLMTNDNGATWITLLTYDSTSVVPATGEHPIVDLTAYSGQTVQFGILGSEGTVDDTNDNDVFVDNFQVRNIPTCPEPSDLAVTNITPDGGELSWTEAGTSTVWNVEIVPAGTTPTGTPTATNVSNPYIVTGLDAITAYDFYVQADCGGDLSSFTGPFTFSTLCDIFVPDYLQDFATIIPDCWDEADSGDAVTGPGDFGAGSWGNDGFLNNGFTGAYKINLWVANKSDWIISPQFDLTGGPFQVEFDFGIMTFGSSTTAGTLGSDDTVQLLMTNDNGATWITLLTYDSTSVVPATGAHPIVDLTAYSGQTVQFGILGSEGTVDDTNDNDVFVDNFRVRAIPTCPEPSDLTATNLSLTSTEVGWTEAGTASSWNIEYGIAGFDLGTGTVEAGVTTNPFVLDGLTSDTSYEFYVQAICGPGDDSSWTGPFAFFTGYCESIPSSNDGDGVNYVTIGVTDFISFGDEFYENHTTPVVDVFQGINTSVEIEFAHVFTYFTNIWIDFNDDLVFDATELVYQGESTGGNNPHILDASFVMPLTATLGEHRMRIGTADSGQATPNPCYNGSWGVTLDFTVNIQELNCTLAEADYTTVPDCENDQFFIDVNITSLGDATSLEISNNYDAGTVQATALGVYQAGPFPFGSAVKVFVTNEQDNNCVISSETYEVLACPPSNDECATATVAVVNAGESCDQVNSGTILAATPSGVPSGSCAGNPDDDVWFQFTALGDQQLIQILNIAGGTFNIDHALYEGSCGSLTEMYCSADDFSLTPSLIVGNTYYVRVFSAGSNTETSTFDLCIGTLGIPTYCLDALPICADPDIEYESIVGDQTAPPYLDYDCLGSQPDPQWNTILFDEPGDYEFSLDQTNGAGTGLDIDFIVWGPFVDQQGGCVELLPESIADCSFSATASETITLTGVPANSTYIILITNYSQESGTYTFVQDSGPPDGTNCDVVCDVVLSYDGAPVEDVVEAPAEVDQVFDPCGYEDGVLLEATTFYNVDSYVWYFNGFAIEDYNQPTLTATETGTYQVQVLGGICDQSLTYFSALIEINFYDSPENLEPQSITVCDGPEADGTETFNLDDFTASLGLDGFTVSYYTNTDDANQAINAVASMYDSSGEILIMRIEDEDAAANEYLGCRKLSQVELIVNDIPVAGQPSNLEICSATGIASFTLTNNDLDVLNGLDASNYTVSYHASMEDAQNSNSALASPYTNTSNPQTIYVRLEDNTTSCVGFTTFDLIISEPSQTANSENILECDDNDTMIDGFADFDLDAHTSVVLGTQNASDYNVTYYESQADADAGVNSISGVISSDGETIYVRVEDATTPNCYVTNSFDLVVNVVPLAEFDPQIEYQVCPNATVPITIGIVPTNFTGSDVTVNWSLDGTPFSGSGLTLNTVLDAGEYSATITFNDTGCVNTISTEVIELESCVFPEGISPNNDMMNDTFDLSSFNVTKLEIFNRNGTLVYSKTNYVDEWFGQTNDGDELPVGTYFYTVIYEGGAKSKSAWVYINR